MSIFNRCISCGIVFSAALFLAGCEGWSSGGGTDSYNTNPDNVDRVVAGVYRSAVAGNPIVIDYGSQGRLQVTDENIATGDGSRVIFSGGFDHGGIIPGTVTIRAGGKTFTDNGNGALTGSPSGSGTVDYGAGRFRVDYLSALGAGTPMLASYEYSQASSGASSATIQSLNVQQVGNRISITDNNGDKYEGSLGNAQVTQSTQTTAERVQAQLSVQYQVKGTSKGIPVTMTGVFNISEVVYFSPNDEGTLVERFRIYGLSMDGTWIEPRAQGDISAVGPQNQRVEVLE